ncbi:MAG: DEAD/DEAH box helicase, partial [Candidatus Cloacimonadota bacterium]
MKLAKNKSISDTFIAFDLETTGLDSSDRIIEIGAVRVQNKEIVDTYQTLINPRMHVPLEIIILTGIQEEEIKEAPFLEDIKDDVLHFLGRTPLIAHNAPFDISFLEKEAGNLNNPVIDTLKLSRILLPFIKNHKLKTLYNLLENGEPAFHRALEDAIATSKIYVKLLNIIESLPTEILKKIRSIADTLTDDSLRLFIDAHNRSGVRTVRESVCGITQYAPIPSNVIEFKAEDEKHSFEASEKCVEEILSDESMINKAGIKYEHRPEQIGLSKMVMGAFLSDEILVAEAGTGTGKTFAYLIPSILWSTFSEQRVLVSTYTKNLEDQIFNNDIVNISKTLGISFKASLIKGRNNYLCLRRWFNMVQVQFTALEQEDRYALLNLITWQHLTQTGDISENSSLHIQQKQPLWSLLSCDLKDCEMNKCSYFANCYLAKIRKEIQDSNIVVLNHSLLLSDLNAEQKILGEYHRLIIDEAHNLERAATDFLGDMITSRYLRNMLDRLFKRGKGLLITLRETIKILGEESMPVTLIDIKKCIELVIKSKEILAQISKSIAESLQQAEYKSICRLTKASTLLEELNPYNEIFFSNLCTINEVLESFIDHLSESKQRAMGKRNVDEITELTAELNDMKERFHSLFSCEESNMCYWVELCDGFENFKAISATIVIADMLKERLFDRIQTGVLVSATILVESSFGYFNQKLGLVRNERVAEFHTGTSFDFDKQV